MQPFVKVENLCVCFGDHLALQDVTLQLDKGDFLAVVGPNGAGKSTFLKVLLGLVRPSKGIVKIMGVDPEEVDPGLIGYVPQVKTMDRTFPSLSLELVMTGLNSRWPWRMKKEQKEKALAALKLVGAAHLAERSISKLSGGELQRVCLARSIVREPQLIMLDEPATGIDAVGEADLYLQLERYQKKTDATIIMITHDWHAAMHHANKVLLLNKKMIAYGKPSEVLNEAHLRRAFGHVGHTHHLKFLEGSHD
ncbi:MAG: ABC transporter ATP-binding protein [Calditrichia bacterium]